VERGSSRREAVVDLLVGTRPGPGCTVVEVRGELDMATSVQLQESLRRLVDAGDRHLVVDLAEVGFMDSSGLGALVTVFQTLTDADGWLRLAAVQPTVRRVLSITSVDRAIGVYDSVEEAAADASPAGG
jgi:anti-sigma B factor antagonist